MSTFIKNSQNIKVNIQSSSPQNTTEKIKRDVNVCDRAGDDVIRRHKQRPLNTIPTEELYKLHFEFF